MAMNEKWKGGKSTNADPKLRILRSASTAANYKYGMGGLPRKNKTVKPVSLKKLKCLDDDDSSYAGLERQGKS